MQNQGQRKSQETQYNETTVTNFDKYRKGKYHIFSNFLLGASFPLFLFVASYSVEPDKQNRFGRSDFLWRSLNGFSIFCSSRFRVRVLPIRVFFIRDFVVESLFTMDYLIIAKHTQHQSNITNKLPMVGPHETYCVSWDFH